MINVLITGSQGQLAQALYRTQSATGCPIAAVYKSRQGLDITNLTQLRSYLEQNPVHYLINCAAYTQVDLAETEQKKAHVTNALAPGYLANLAKELQFTLIHISTDYVFEGTLPLPLTETMLTTPINYYGQTKLQGEQNILIRNNAAYIIRTSWLYSTLGNNFLTRLLKQPSSEKQTNMAYDQVSSPTYALDLADTIWKIIYQLHHNTGSYQPGIYHYTNEGIASRYDFAWQISKKLNLDLEIIPQPSSSSTRIAKRPAYSVLNKEKIKQAFGLTIPNWEASLEHCLEEIQRTKLK